MKKGLNKYPFWIQVVCMPFTYIIAVLKVLVVIPVWIIAKCNGIMENAEND